MRAAAAVVAVTVITIVIAATVAGEQLPVRTFTTADGLPRDQLACVRTDTRGFVWFCTAEGLVRFDGQVAVTFGRDDGLSPAGVRSFLTTNRGQYFVGADAGLFEFDAAPIGSRERFRLIARDDRERTGAINAIAEARDGSIWCGSGRGLLHLTTSGGQRRLSAVDIGLSQQNEDDQIVRAILEDRQGTLWVGAASGLYVRSSNGRTTRFTTRDGLPADEVLALALDERGRLWAGTRQGLALIDRTAVDRDGSRLVTRVFTERHGLPGRNIRALHVDGSTLWVATVFGIAETTLTASADLTVGQTLTGFFAWGVTTDLRGDVWAATEAGARRLMRHGFTTYTEPDGLPSSRITAVFENADRQVCATSEAGRFELSCFDGRRFQRVPVRAANALQDPGWGWSQLTFQDTSRDWWIPTGEGLFRFGPLATSRLASATPIAVYGRTSGLLSDNIFRVFGDSRGGVWIATYAATGNGLARLDPSTGSIHTFGSRDGLPAVLPIVHSFAEDHTGAIWIGLEERHLLRYRTRFEDVALMPRSPGDVRVPYEEISSLLVDRRGRLWIASNVNGIARIDDPYAQMPVVTWYGARQGLSSETAWTLIESRSGEIFIGTGRGVDRLDPQTGHFTHYSADAGVPRGEIRGAIRDERGRLWFATTAGVARFETDADGPPARAATFITAIRVAGMPIAIRADGAPRVDAITLQPGDRRIDIDFVSPGARAADGVTYQHQLAGVDRGWTTTDARSIALAAVAPGSYRFLVRAALASDVVSEPAEVDFVVLAPIWQRTWFIALALTMTAAIALVVHRIRVRRLLAVERVRSRIAADLHDGVGASLSRIAILSEVVQQQARSTLPAAMPALAAIGENARAVIDDMSDAVWFIDPRLDTLQDLTSRFRALASELFDGQQIGWTIEPPDHTTHIALASEQRRHLYLTVKESITNIVRHARATHVTIRIVVSRGRLRIEIADDGIGRASEDGLTSGSGRGIESMRSRAAALGGTCMVLHGSGDRGTLVVLDVPLRRGARNAALEHSGG